MVIEITTDSELDKAADIFFRAAYAYRDAIKKYAPRELGGAIFVRRGNECVVYAESSRYTEQICSMTFDQYKDELIFTQPNDDDDDE